MLRLRGNIDYSLYLVTYEYTGQAHERFMKQIENALIGGVTVVQLRAKHLSGKEFYELALEVKELVHHYKVPFIVNDRLDIALGVDADGLHIGQEDIPADVARRWIGDNKILGVSAKTVEEARRAVLDGADYLGVGSMFPTATKKDAVVTSFAELQKIKQSVEIPIVAIGGINLQNVKQLKEAGVQGIAVVSAILQKDDPRLAAKELLKAFKD